MAKLELARCCSNQVSRRNVSSDSPSGSCDIREPTPSHVGLPGCPTVGMHISSSDFTLYSWTMARHVGLQSIRGIDSTDFIPEFDSVEISESEFTARPDFWRYMEIPCTAKIALVNYLLG